MDILTVAVITKVVAKNAYTLQPNHTGNHSKPNTIKTAQTSQEKETQRPHTRLNGELSLVASAWVPKCYLFVFAQN
jgi:hypothetical protein